MERIIKAKAEVKSLDTKATNSSGSTPIKSILKKPEEEIKVEEVLEDGTNATESVKIETSNLENIEMR